MPWDIVKSGNKYKVIKQTTGKVAGTHSTRAEAEAQMRALYANVEDKKPMSSPGTMHRRLRGGVVVLNDQYRPEPATHGYVDGKRVEFRRYGGAVPFRRAQKRRVSETSSTMKRPVSETSSVVKKPISETSSVGPVPPTLGKPVGSVRRRGGPIGPGVRGPGKSMVSPSALVGVNKAITSIMESQGIDRAAATDMLRKIGRNRAYFKKNRRSISGAGVGAGFKHGGTVMGKVKSVAARKKSAKSS